MVIMNNENEKIINKFKKDYPFHIYQQMDVNIHQRQLINEENNLS